MKNLFNYHLHRGVYTNGNYYSTDLLEVANKTKQLTFNRYFLDPEYKHEYPVTPFNEIKFALPHEYINLKHIDLLDDNYQYTNLKLFINLLKDALSSYFIKVLQPNQKYIVFHSAGFDSRIISLTLMELRDNGFDHITKNIHFRCHQPEGPMFNEIMIRQGWLQNQFSVYNGPKLDYYNIGRKQDVLNGWQNYNQTMNFWSDLILEPEQKEWIAITGLGGELFKFLAQPKKTHNVYKRTNNNTLNFMYHHYPNNGEWEGYYMRIFKDLLQPFFSYDYLNVALKVNPEWCIFDGERDSIRSAIVQSYINHGVDCYNIRYGHHDYSWNISQQRLNQMYTDYKNSLFYKDHGKHTNMPDLTKLYGWNAQIYGFMTVYDKIFNS